MHFVVYAIFSLWWVCSLSLASFETGSTTTVGVVGDIRDVAVDSSGVVYGLAGNRVIQLLANGSALTLAGGSAGFRDGPALLRSSTTPRESAS